jgi:hypothetical protein
MSGQLGAAYRTSGPVEAWGPDRLDVFVVGNDNALYHKWWNGKAWRPSLTDYERQGDGHCFSRAEAVSWTSDRLDLFVVGEDASLRHKWWDGKAWGPSPTDYENLGGVCHGTPH